MYVHVRDILYMSSVFTVFLVFSFFISFLKHFGYLFVYLDFHMCYREREKQKIKIKNWIFYLYIHVLDISLFHYYFIRISFSKLNEGLGYGV
jgi:hypothetical protein